MKAVILAAGEGARMGPFTASEPKVMIPVGNRPILEHVVRALAEQDVRDIVIVVGYRRERIMSYFEDGKPFDARIEYAVEGKQLGTGHSLSEARPKVQGEFLVLNGSNLLDHHAISDLIEGRHGPSVLITESENPSKYGVVLLSEDRVSKIVEKPREPIGNLINTGAYALDESIFPAIEALARQGKHDLPSAVEALSATKPVRAIRTKGMWQDALYPWDLLRLNAEVLKSVHSVKAGTIESGVTIRGKVSIGDGTVLRGGSYIQGPVSIGEGCEVGPQSVILNEGGDIQGGGHAISSRFEAVQASSVLSTARWYSGPRSSRLPSSSAAFHASTSRDVVGNCGAGSSGCAVLAIITMTGR